MNAYTVQGTVTHVTADGWRGTVQVPTFYLSADVQGIRDAAHAERIARDIIDPLHTAADVSVFVMPTEIRPTAPRRAAAVTYN